MPITNFEFPSVTLKQQFDDSTAATVPTLGTVCVGPQFYLHRADTEGEAAKLTGTYSTTSGIASQSIPNPKSSDLDVDMDTDSHRLVVKNAMLSYASTVADEAAIQPSPDDTQINFKFSVKDSLVTAADARFGTRGVQIGDTVILTDSAQSTTKVIATVLGIKFIVYTDASGVEHSGYAAIIVDTVGEFTSTSSVLVTFCAKSEVTYKETSTTFSITKTTSGVNVTVQGGLTSEIAGISTAAVLISGDFYVEYREFNQVNNKTVGTISHLSDIEDQLGAVCKDNPLAVALYMAKLSAGTEVVYYITTKNSDISSYLEALDYADNYANIYNVCLATEDAATIVACHGVCVSASEGEDSKIRRSLWYGMTTPSEIVKASGDCSITTLSEEPTVTKLTFATAALADIDLQSGDYFENTATGTRYTPAKDSDGNYRTNGVNWVIVTGAIGGTTGTFALVRTLPNNNELIQAIIAAKPVSHYRAQCVWGDDCILNGEYYGGYALAAAAAGMRSVEYPHRPISNLGYAGFSIAETHGFTKSQFVTIASNGIWVIANNDSGIPINKRQVTSAVANVLMKDEESMIANGDSIALAICRLGEDRVGCSNINPTMLTLLLIDLEEAMRQFLVDNSSSPYIGPQLLSYEVTQFYQDTVNKDRVYATIECEPPRPFNKFSMTLRLV